MALIMQCKITIYAKKKKCLQNQEIMKQNCVFLRMFLDSLKRIICHAITSKP